MKKIQLTILLLFIYITTGVHSAYAETYHFASGEFQPFTGVDLENGGLTTEIVNRVISTMNDSTKITYLPWRRGHIKTLNGEFFGIYPYSKNEERLKSWLYSSTLYDLQETFFTSTDKNIRYSEHSDLQGLSICKPIGYNLFGLKKLHESGVISLERPPDLKACFLMLNLGRVDLVMTNPSTAWEMISHLKLDTSKFRQLKKPFEKNTHHLIVPKTNPGGKAFITRFDKALLKLKKKGVIQDILAKHL